MTAIRSASWSASSSCWVVSSTVVPFVHQCAHRRPDLVAPARVQPGRRLVQEQHRGREDQARRRGRAGAASRPSTAPTGLPPVSASPKRSSSSSARARARATPRWIQPPEQHEVLPPAEHLVDRGVLPDEPDPPPHARRVARHVDARRPPRARRPARSSVVRIRTAVVLPAPLGPSSPHTVPARTARSSPASASSAPNRLRSPPRRPAYLRTPYGVYVHDTEFQVTEYGGSGDPERSLELLWRVARRSPSAAQAKARPRPDRRGGDRARRRGGPGAALDAQGRGAPGVGTMSLYTYVPGKAGAAGPDARRQRRAVNARRRRHRGARGSSRSRARTGSATTGTRGCSRSRWSARCWART